MHMYQSLLALGLLASRVAAAPNDILLAQARAKGNFIAPQPWSPSDSIAPEVQDLPSSTVIDGRNVKRTKIRSGKYVLPKTSSRTWLSWLSGEPGVMSTIAFNMKKPCDGECALLSLQATLEYANGTEATTQAGAWLHHMVLVRSGSGRTDSACGFPFERIFSSGNERTVVGTRKQSDKTGLTAALQLRSSDTFSAQIELMNLLDQTQDVWLTMTYEYLPGEFPKDWRKLAVVWLDVTGCGPSFARPPDQQQYTLSNKWTSTLSGEILGAGGHVHDGGTDVSLFKNDNKICKSQASYSTGQPEKPKEGEQAQQPMKHSLVTVAGADEEMPHVSEMSICYDIGRIQKGDKVEIDATYDLSKHKTMKTTSGGESMVMGIALMYVALDP